MPTTTFDSNHRAQLANRSRRSLEDTRMHARRAAEASRINRQLTEQKNNLVAKNPNLTNVDAQQRTIYIWMLLGLVAVYVLDVVLFASVSEYIINQTISGSPWLSNIARYLIPAAIIVMENLISIHRELAYRKLLEDFGSRPRLWAWTMVAVLSTILIPMLVIAIVVAGEGDDFTSWVSIPLTIGLAGLSLIAHLLMVFGGSLAMEAKSWAIMRGQMRALEGRLRQSGQTYARHSQVAADRFAAYLQDLNDHNNTYPNARIEVGSFDRDTRDVLNEIHGYEVIRTPAAPVTATPANPRPKSSENPPQNPQADASNWRDEYDSQMRDHESEVRP